MNLFTAIGSQFVKIGRRLQGVALSSGSRVFTVSSPEVYANIDERSAVTEGFNGNVSVYSIVMKDAKKFGSIPRYIYDAKKTEAKAITDKVDLGAINVLLNRPNKYQSQDMFLTTVRAYYKICGESMIWLNRGPLDNYRLPDGSLDDMAIDRLPVLEMHVLPAYAMTAIPDDTDLWGILGWVLEAGDRVVIRAGDVIHWKNVNLNFDAATREHLRGMSPLTPGAKTLAEGNSLSRFSMRSAQNDGAKAIIFNETMDNMTPTQQSDMKRVVDAKINNNDVAGQVATLQGKWGALNLAMSSKDLEVLDKKKFNWQEMCFLLEVPVELFDPNVIHANKEGAQVGWITNDLIPACKQLDGEMNRVLLKAFSLEGRAFIATDASQLPEIQKVMAETAKTMLENWTLTPDDVREFLGYEKLGGEFGEPWVVQGRTPLSRSAEPDEDIASELEQNRIAYERGTVKRPGDGEVSED